MALTTGTPHPAAVEAWRLLAELFHSHKHRFACIAAEFELSPPQVWALRALDPAGPVPMSSLAGVLRCDASNVTGIVDRLEIRGLVERRPAPRDRRVKLLVLTPEGVAMREQLVARLDAPPEGLAALSEDDQALLRDLLARAVAADRAG
jgi:DNA-binding MarR family transcriptional regulator